MRSKVTHQHGPATITQDDEHVTFRLHNGAGGFTHYVRSGQTVIEVGPDRLHKIDLRGFNDVRLIDMTGSIRGISEGETTDFGGARVSRLSLIVKVEHPALSLMRAIGGIEVRYGERREWSRFLEVQDGGIAPIPGV